ncbi:adenylate/guanylate cyclase domain-containing protein [Algiphilus sp.]|uniref:adenylate/guanylate cyclase domain-containing protein n=1 Tax=Algiphilus sp. TaxID=1872431 RepID=UPI003C319F53
MDQLVASLAAANSGLFVAAIIAAGIGLAFLVSDWATPSSRWMASALMAAGGSIALNAHLIVLPVDALPWWARLAGFVEALAFICGVEWGIRVSRTASERSEVLPPRLGPSRYAELAIGFYGLLAALFPARRIQHLLGAFEGEWLLSPWFWLFATLPTIAVALIIWASVQMLRQRPDKAEAGRVISLLIVLPLLGLAYVVPLDWAPVAVALAEVVFLFGALRYFMVQGARNQFMSRFMAPQVAELVRTRGLRQAMRRHRVRVSVVCVDIRGFTAYAHGVPPETVLRLLRDFYAAVGMASARHGGTIKDLAGDGALIVLGAPVAMEDHASRALQLARRLQTHTRPVVKRYHNRLGLGVGVATGEVAVGIVGHRARFEYVAVGPAVNLAARLCDRARDGEIRVDADTLQLAGETPRSKPLRRYVKGLSDPVPTYVLSPGDGRRER